MPLAYVLFKKASTSVRLGARLFQELILICSETGTSLDFADGSEKIVKLIPTDNEIRIIFFEANLGYPAHESLSTPTVEVLKFLIQSCPEATFILKSHTNKAIQNAQDILQEEKISSERIFPDGGPLKMSDTLKQVMCEAFNEQRSKITLR